MDKDNSAAAWPTAAIAPPAVIHVLAGNVGSSPAIARLVQDVRERADAFVFLVGGASKMSSEVRSRVLSLLEAFALLANDGLRLAVGDGGTQAGIMEAAGLARRATGGAFALIGVAPAPAVSANKEPGKTPIDPNHSYIVTVEDLAWAARRRAEGWEPEDGYWGSETATMYAIFHRLAVGRHSVALVANGGAIALDEVWENLGQNRPIIVVAGSGRAADALIHVLNGTTPHDEEILRLREKAASLDSPALRALVRVFKLEDGPRALARSLEAILRKA
jgi:hypothetical protein